MSEEFQEKRYSVFWPMLILLVTLAGSIIYQLGQMAQTNSALSKRYAAESVNLPRAQEAQNRLVSLVNDLIATSAKDPNAALVVEEAKQAGILHDRPTDTNAAPANGP